MADSKNIKNQGSSSDELKITNITKQFPLNRPGYRVFKIVSRKSAPPYYLCDDGEHIGKTSRRRETVLDMMKRKNRVNYSKYHDAKAKFDTLDYKDPKDDRDHRWDALKKNEGLVIPTKMEELKRQLWALSCAPFNNAKADAKKIIKASNLSQADKTRFEKMIDAWEENNYLTQLATLVTSVQSTKPQNVDLVILSEGKKYKKANYDAGLNADIMNTRLNSVADNGASSGSTSATGVGLGEDLLQEAQPRAARRTHASSNKAKTSATTNSADNANTANTTNTQKIKNELRNEPKSGNKMDKQYIVKLCRDILKKGNPIDDKGKEEKEELNNKLEYAITQDFKDKKNAEQMASIIARLLVSSYELSGTTVPNTFHELLRATTKLPMGTSEMLVEFFKLYQEGLLGKNYEDFHLANDDRLIVNLPGFWDEVSPESFLYRARVLSQLTSIDKIRNFFSNSENIANNLDMLFEGENKNNKLKKAGYNDYRVDKAGTPTNIYSVLKQWEKRSPKKNTKKENVQAKQIIDTIQNNKSVMNELPEEAKQNMKELRKLDNEVALKAFGDAIAKIKPSDYSQKA